MRPRHSLISNLFSLLFALHPHLPHLSSASTMSASSLHSFLDSVFHLSHHGTDVGTELRAGLTSFVSSSYLLLLIPHLFLNSNPLSSPSPLHVTCAVGLTSAAATLLSALLTNYPLVLTPGLGLTALYTTALASSPSPHLPAASTLFAAVLLVLLSALPVHRIARALIPDPAQGGRYVGAWFARGPHWPHRCWPRAAPHVEPPLTHPCPFGMDTGAGAWRAVDGGATVALEGTGGRCCGG